MLVAQSLKDALGGVLLLGRPLPILIQDLVDHRDQRRQALASQAAGFAHSLAAQSSGTSWPPCPGSTRTPAPPPGDCAPPEKQTAGPPAYVSTTEHPQAFPDQIRAVRLSLAGFYAARSRITPPLQWPTLSPPRTPLRQRLDELMGGGELGINARALRLLEDLRDEWASLDRRVKAHDDELAALTARTAWRDGLATSPGIGVIKPPRLLAAVGDGSAFSKGGLAAWLGLTPRQHSTGGRTKLLGISKRGNKYIRTQLIHGARAAMAHFGQTPVDAGVKLPRTGRLKTPSWTSAAGLLGAPREPGGCDLPMLSR